MYAVQDSVIFLFLIRSINEEKKQISPAAKIRNPVKVQTICPEIETNVGGPAKKV
ncbi:MAG: hypothetical protein WED07_13260 [Candidatus Freyarchaeum deiterrae]